MKRYLQFETERLLLKAASTEDAPFILTLFNAPNWIKYIGDRNMNTVVEAEKYIAAKMIPQQERLGFSNYVVIRKADGVKMGTCGVYDRDGLEGLDIGFAFLPEYEGQGYAYESANKMKEAARDLFGQAELKAITTHDNASSQKLLKKLGFKSEGKTKIKDDEEELLLFRLVF